MDSFEPTLNHDDSGLDPFDIDSFLNLNGLISGAHAQAGNLSTSSTTRFEHQQSFGGSASVYDAVYQNHQHAQGTSISNQSESPFTAIQNIHLAPSPGSIIGNRLADDSFDIEFHQWLTQPDLEDDASFLFPAHNELPIESTETSFNSSVAEIQDNTIFEGTSTDEVPDHVVNDTHPVALQLTSPPIHSTYPSLSQSPPHQSTCFPLKGINRSSEPTAPMSIFGQAGLPSLFPDNFQMPEGTTSITITFNQGNMSAQNLHSGVVSNDSTRSSMHTITLPSQTHFSEKTGLSSLATNQPSPIQAMTSASETANQHPSSFSGLDLKFKAYDPTNASKSKRTPRKRQRHIAQGSTRKLEASGRPQSRSQETIVSRDEEIVEITKESILDRVAVPRPSILQSNQPFAQSDYQVVIKDSAKPQKRKRYEEDRLEEVNKIRKIGSCFTCQFKKISCSDATGLGGRCAECIKHQKNYYRKQALDILELPCIRQSLLELRFGYLELNEGEYSGWINWDVINQKAKVMEHMKTENFTGSIQNTPELLKHEATLLRCVCSALFVKDATRKELLRSEKYKLLVSFFFVLYSIYRRNRSHILDMEQAILRLLSLYWPGTYYRIAEEMHLLIAAYGVSQLQYCRLFSPRWWVMIEHLQSMALTMSQTAVQGKA